MTDPTKDSKLSGLRVLIVEDEAQVALQLEDLLDELGCLVVGPASRVGQAVTLLERQAVDAAILDLNVAGELVYPVADQLAAHGIPFIFATGYGSTAIAASYRTGPILEKPFSLAQLSKTLLDALP